MLWCTFYASFRLQRPPAEVKCILNDSARAASTLVFDVLNIGFNWLALGLCMTYGAFLLQPVQLRLPGYYVLLYL